MFPLVLGLAVLFRLMMLFTAPPTLSDDVYRYIWDGRLMNAGVNPYAHAVESPVLDALDTPQRALVNHPWMASPYLPVAQLFFAAVYWLVPDSPLAFQVASVLLDLLTGLLVADLLRRVGRPPAQALIYLWNPLVVVEFAHGAHVDALTICLMVAALWLLITVRSKLLSAVALAAATLTKGLPLLLLPVVARRWGWRRTLVYAGLSATVCFLFALGVGWGLMGSLDGEGLFGALRIYAEQWSFNGSLYPMLEIALSAILGPWVLDPWPVWIAKLVSGGALGVVLIAVWWMGRTCDDDLALLRLAVIPLAAYLMLTTTVHPWYVTIVVPLLPFLSPEEEESRRAARFLLPLLVFSALVPLSYVAYLDPAGLRVIELAHLAEYVPVYLLLIWAAWPVSGGVSSVRSRKRRV
jgi:hypothetical protein